MKKATQASTTGGSRSKTACGQAAFQVSLIDGQADRTTVARTGAALSHSRLCSTCCRSSSASSRDSRQGGLVLFSPSSSSSSSLRLKFPWSSPGRTRMDVMCCANSGLLTSVKTRLHILIASSTVNSDFCRDIAQQGCDSNWTWKRALEGLNSRNAGRRCCQARWRVALETWRVRLRI